MANTVVLLASSTYGAVGGAVTFSNINQTYTDLLLLISARAANGASESIGIQFNNTTASYSEVLLRNVEGILSSSRNWVAPTFMSAGEMASTLQGSNYFGFTEFYIPNYTNTNHNRFASTFAVRDNNSTTGRFSIFGTAHLSQDSNAVTSLKISSSSPNGSSNHFDTGSSFYLYGIKSS